MVFMTPSVCLLPSGPCSGIVSRTVAILHRRPVGGDKSVHDLRHMQDSKSHHLNAMGGQVGVDALHTQPLQSEVDGLMCTLHGVCQ